MSVKLKLTKDAVAEEWKAPPPVWSRGFRAQRKWKPIQVLQVFEIATALAHGIQFALVVVLTRHKDLRVPTNVSYVLWPPRSATNKYFTMHTSHVGSLSLARAVYSFFGLSFLFQFLAVTLFWKRFARSMLLDYNQLARWHEYSISASVMGLIFASLSNVLDANQLMMVFVLLFATMMLGLVQEKVMTAYIHRKQDNQHLREVSADLTAAVGALDTDTRDTVAHLVDSISPPPDKHVQLQFLFGAHLVGWVTFVAPCFLFASRFFLTVQHSAERPPAWVYAVYLSQFLFFGSFGFVQLVSQLALYYAGTDERKLQQIAIRTEVAYTTLSLCAKSVLAWVLYSNAIVESSIKY